MADPSVISPAPLDPASLRASRLCSEGVEESGCPAHTRVALGKGRICASRRENESRGDSRAVPAAERGTGVSGDCQLLSGRSGRNALAGLAWL